MFQQEAEALAASRHDLTKQLCISKKAHLILPTHRILDAAYEAAKGSGKIGTTGKGIGPTYTDKISRNGLRVGDLLHNFDEKYAAAKARHEAILRSLNYEYNITELEAQWFKALDYLKQFRLIDSEHVINNYLKEGKSVLAEGAQGTMLDIDFGSYPFVTSSNTICAGCCTGLGFLRVTSVKFMESSRLIAHVSVAARSRQSCLMKQAARSVRSVMNMAL